MPRFPQADGRSVGKRKRSADKFRGPLIFVCELINKRLIKAGFAAAYIVLSNGDVPSLVRFVNALGVTDRFLETLLRLVEIQERRHGISLDLVGDVLALGGEYSLWLYYAHFGWWPWSPGIDRGDVAPAFAEIKPLSWTPKGWTPF